MTGRASRGSGLRCLLGIRRGGHRERNAKAVLNGFECRHRLKLSDAWMGLTNTGGVGEQRLKANRVSFDSA